jgi:hypothetical protein
MNDQLYCPSETRKALVRDQGVLNGIDYLHVLDDETPAGSPRQRTLLVHCLRDLDALDRRNVLIEGGVRVRNVDVAWAFRADAIPPGTLGPGEAALDAYLQAALTDPARVLVVRTDSAGDFSTYTLRLVLSPSQPDEPPAGFDRQLATVGFTFKIDCPSDFDCASGEDCPEVTAATPPIDYLARDYASFRRLMLDRMAVVMPAWQERNAADTGIAVVEVLAYAADHLSYAQDAVATEAYLGTARRRASVRRHARMIDYVMHDGANARAWVAFEVEAGALSTLPAGTRILGSGAAASTVVRLAGLQDAVASAPVVFETLHDLRLVPGRSAIPFHTWGDPDCCLPRGATRATLSGVAAALDLHAGDVLVFEEVRGVEGDRVPEDADRTRRHAVRLNTEPIARIDALDGTPVLDIAWHTADALPFALRLHQFTGSDGEIQHTSMAFGNVVLADHGLTSIQPETLLPEGQVPDSGRYRPRLRETGVTQAMPYIDEVARLQPAASALQVDLRAVLPAVTLSGEFQIWLPQRDLLNSDPFAPEFVVEMESDGVAWIRFGDDVLGRRPAPGSSFTASYRTGNGTTGNVGAGALGRVVTDAPGIARVWNPLPATGGVDPEPIEQVQLQAPAAFRTQARAVTAADYAVAAQTHPEVQRANATRRWTGSWYTWFVTTDRTGGLPVDPAFESAFGSYLDRFRLAGYDLEIDPPRFVPLDIALTVCVAPGYLRGNVHQALLDTFGSGEAGFFHPDRFTFGQTVYLSQIVARAMEVPGVDWVHPIRFQRWDQEPHGELEAGRITLARLEIARLDNDPNAAENGRLEFVMQGGL